MFFVLTPAGETALANSVTPPTLTLFRCGSNFGYVPDPGMTNIQGTSVASGQPSEAVVQNASLLKYTIHLDATLGDFYFGEVGLYLPGNILFAIGASTSPIQKLRNVGAQVGNDLAIDCYISTSGTSFSIFAELGNSANELNVQALPNVDVLPRAVQAYPNIFQVSSPDHAGSVLAFSNNSVWSVSGYEEIIDEQYVVSATVNSCTVATDSFAPVFPGELIAQWTTGELMGVMRVIAGYSSASKRFTFNTPLASLPSANDKIQILKKTQLRPNVAELLAGLDVSLTAGDLNSLLTNPLGGFVRRDGSTAMLAPLDLGNQRVKNVALPILDGDAANKQYVDSSLGTSAGLINNLNTQVSQVLSTYVRKDGTIAMTGNFNFGGFRGMNLAAPVAANDAATKGYIDLTVQALTSSIVSDHKDLQGLQGGMTDEYYHLTSAQYAFVSNLVGVGYPIAGYGQPGIAAFSTPFEVGGGSVNNEGVTPESLYLALTNAGVTPNNLQSAVVSTINSYLTFMRFGSGAPTNATPNTPPTYCDTSNGSYRLYVYNANVWHDVSGTIVRYGTGAPNAGTLKEPPVYVDVSTFPYTQYFYRAGVWTKAGGPYLQFGFGAPTAATPTEPSVYYNTAVTPLKQYVYQGGNWIQSGQDSAVTTTAKLFFFSQF
jgi:hypothetical protein